MKTYTSKTEISLSIRLGNGAHMHVRFSPTSDGGSMYVTSNPVIQKGLERHPQFGKMFILASEVNESAPAPEVKKAETKAEGKKVVEVRSTQDAKEYLVETFGISRTQLTSKAKILANAESHNIVFNGLN